MKIKCDYCGNTYEDTLEKCPSCGGPNPSHKNDNRPKTIEELKIWYQERNLPAPEVTRFFIGTDYRQPKAFGIYKDDQGVFVSDGKNEKDGILNVLKNQLAERSISTKMGHDYLTGLYP